MARSYWRAKLTARQIGQRGRRILGKTVQALVPFRLRQQVRGLVYGRSNAETPAKGWPFLSPKTYDVICFPIIEWDFLFQRPQQLLTQFAKHGHRSFYLRTKFHQSGARAYVRSLGENIYGIRMPGPKKMSVYQSEIGDQQLKDMTASLDELCREASLKDTICIVQLPFWAPLAFAAQEKWGWKIIYDCMDEHSGFSTNAIAMLKHEEELMARSDLVIVTSKRLHERASRLARQTLFLPNAADFDHFSKPRHLRPLAGIGSPIIGYYGSISYWFDVGMIYQAATARPGWQFVLIGDTFGSDLSKLKRLSNVYILGKQPYSVLPAYLHQFDVACIPFLINPLTEAADPVKFYEYLSAGKPVVAVELPELEPYRNHFYPVRTGEDFIMQTEAALSERSTEKIQARMEIARQNTWTSRYKTLDEAIRQL